MAQTREIAYPLIFTAPQLSYLLALVNAEGLLGSDEQALFPRDIAVRESQWAQGRDQLEADRWLVYDEEAKHYDINDQLMEIVATMADPGIVVLSKWEANLQQHGTAHYLTPGLIVEMTILDREYHIYALESQAQLIERLAAAIDFPASQREAVAFVLPRQDIDQAKRNPDAGWLESRGLSPQAADVFAATLRQPQLYGMVTVLRTYQGKALTMRLLGIVTAAPGYGWLAKPQEGERVRYELADRQEFGGQLGALIEELATTPIGELVETQDS